MAFWVPGGGGSELRPDGARCWHGHGLSLDGHDSSSYDCYSDYHGHDHNHHHPLNRPLNRPHNYHHPLKPPSRDAMPLEPSPSDSPPLRNLAFLVLREGDTPASSSPEPDPDPLFSPLPTPGPLSEAPPGFAHGIGSASAPPCAMERTESGLSISSTTSPRDALSSLALDDNDDIATGRVLSDLEAAHLVHAHLTAFRRRCPDSQSERILRALITPKSRAADFPLDNDALRSIFSASNELFFASRLACRVAWDWSHPACGQYESHIVGTTALRRCARLGGWETLIVLSSPILRDTKYNRRLLISTFLHEMIHSFMFVTCGLKASHDGGHTDGFRHIAAIIDDWAGKEFLRLTDMEADLERFRCQDEGRLCPEYNHPVILESRDWLPHADNGNSHHHDHNHNNHHHHHHHHLHHLHHNSHDAAALPPVTYSHHAPVAAAAQGGWQWCEQENFGHHSPYPSSSPYVY
ncbi:hypothetical protein CDD80_5900 [Ophiocordyceps camponoti-rufipedis]|uniref:SprT-like domain-containing protein n=1 Tax=Ophiocordyceps camponoti-rufipedis TaxID=2004952 RepID=A0A2C5YM59_9HYPO|nr:hypothetical protein CDD80_5900 [Ophiocordyceps camponoti-rufipedis]